MTIVFPVQGIDDTGAEDVTTGRDADEPREQRLARSFVRLADTMVSGFDLTAFLHMLAGLCVDLLDADAAGVLLTDERGGIRVAAASSGKAELLALFAAETNGGPCVECVHRPRRHQRGPGGRRPAVAEVLRGGRAVRLPLRARSADAPARRHGRRPVTARHPVRRDAHHVHPARAGAGRRRHDRHPAAAQHRPGGRRHESAADGARLADRHRAGQGRARRHERLPDPDEAFTALRGFARAHHHRLTDLAGRVVDGTADIAAIATFPR